MNFLHDKHILLTRTAEQNKTTAKLVASYHAKAVFFPCLSIEYLPRNIQSSFDILSETTPTTTDIIFSSRNGVLAVANSIKDMRQILQGFRIVAVGKKTAQTLSEYGLKSHIIPEISSQQGLVAAYKAETKPKNVFFFRAEQGNDALLDFFATQNIKTQLVHCYRSICSDDPNKNTKNQLEAGEIDAVFLGSAKTAQFYVQKINHLQLANRPAIVVMSPQVAEAADKLGLTVQVIAKKPSFKAMLDGLNVYFSQASL